MAAKREKEAVEAQLKASKKEEEARGSIKMQKSLRIKHKLMFHENIQNNYILIPSAVYFHLYNRKCAARWKKCSDSC